MWISLICCPCASPVRSLLSKLNRELAFLSAELFQLQMLSLKKTTDREPKAAETELTA